MSKFLKKIFCLFVFLSIFELSSFEEDKTVLIPILARDKGHCLPAFLKCLENFDYDKKLITLYVNTNNNRDNTKELLEDWIEKNEKKYREIIYESHEIEEFDPTIKPHQWGPKMFKILGSIRNKSMQIAIEKEVDYYFIMDCDNFLRPHTLKYLMNKDVPIIAPLLDPIPNPSVPNANFYYKVNRKGYCKHCRDQIYIKLGKKKGTFKVPLVHCTYLIKGEYLEKLGYIDNTKDYEFIIFSRIARNNGVDQYICNEMTFGTFVYPDQAKKTLKEETIMMENFLKKSPFGQLPV